VRAARPLALAAVAAVLALAGTALAAAEGGSAPFESGIASWYGPDFHGRRTSNGEVYDKEKLSCAHRTLPFGSFVLVRNLDNGSSVVVRVNDRGPFAKSRIIDLSEAAARIVGMIPTGTARVSLTLIPREEALAWRGAPVGSGALSESAADSSPAPSAAAAAPPGSRVRIQVASYASESNARSTVDRLAASGLSASIERAGGHFRVVFPDLSPEEARLTETRLRGMGYRNLAVTTRKPERN
jgi:rare lipoprotein A